MGESEFEKIVLQSLNNNCLGHAYLVKVNDNSKSIIDDVVVSIFAYYNSFLSKEDIKKQINMNEYNDLMVIKPDGKFIKKEQIMVLQDEFSTRSLYDGVRIYIIDGAEALNKAAANSLLKFLEEPDGNIIGILLTKSVNKIFKTIISRCQVCSSIKSIDVTDDSLLPIDKVIELENKADNYSIFLDLFANKDREGVRNVLFALLDVYHGFLNGKIDFDQKDVNVLNKRMDALTNLIDDFDYNLNIKLALDKLYYKMFGGK